MDIKRDGSVQDTFIGRRPYTQGGPSGFGKSDQTTQASAFSNPRRYGAIKPNTSEQRKFTYTDANRTPEEMIGLKYVERSSLLKPDRVLVDSFRNSKNIGENQYPGMTALVNESF